MNEKYEYKIIMEETPHAETLEESINGIEEILNKYGNEGWRVFHYDEGISTKTGEEGILIFLMREKKTQTPPIIVRTIDGKQRIVI